MRGRNLCSESNNGIIILNYTRKILLLSFTVSLIPILILGFFSILQSRKLLISREETYLHNILEQANSTLDHFLTLHNDIISSLAWDTSIRNSVDRMYENNYEMFLTNREIFDSKLPVVQAMHKEIDGITLYRHEPVSAQWYTGFLSIKSHRAMVSGGPFSNKTILCL